MVREILLIANSVIGESSLPDFLVATDYSAEFVRVGAFDQLNSPFDCHIVRRGQQEMNVFRHKNESVQAITTFATIPIKHLQENPCVEFDDEQFPAPVRGESYEISSGRGYESSRLQGETSAAESRASFKTLNWHEWNSCPSRLFFVRRFSFRETHALTLGTKENG